jgi:hypothetical protein
MSAVGARRALRTALLFVIAVTVIAQPFAVEFTRAGLTVTEAAAFAKEGDDSGSGGNSGSGDGHSGSGHDDGDKSDDAGRSGEDANNGKDSQQAKQHKLRLGPHGEKIIVDGTVISIIYPDEFREEIRNGMLELRDPEGRIVIRRAATAKDFKRFAH